MQATDGRGLISCFDFLGSGPDPLFLASLGFFGALAAAPQVGVRRRTGTWGTNRFFPCALRREVARDVQDQLRGAWAQASVLPLMFGTIAMFEVMAPSSAFKRRDLRLLLRVGPQRQEAERSIAAPRSR